MLRCKCGRELGDFPEDRVDRGDMDEVVIHVEHTGVDESERISMSSKNFYCSPKCFLDDEVIENIEEKKERWEEERKRTDPALAPKHLKYCKGWHDALNFVLKQLEEADEDESVASNKRIWRLPMIAKDIEEEEGGRIDDE